MRILPSFYVMESDDEVHDGATDILKYSAEGCALMHVRLSLKLGGCLGGWLNRYATTR